MQKVLVTGATGFIGNYVIKELLQKGYKVIATSSNINNAKQKEWFNDVIYLPLDFKLLSGNSNYFEYFKCPDIVLHLAWEGLPNYKQQFHIEENLPRHKMFLNNLLKSGLKNLTVMGTCLEYGMKEGSMSEEMDSKPNNPYSFAKNELRLFLETKKKEFNFNFKWVRLFYMMGAEQSSTSLFSQLDQSLIKGDDSFNMSGGEQVRDFLQVEEVAKNIVKIAIQNKFEGIVNCGSGKEIELKELVNTYLKKCKRTIKLNLGYYPYLDYEPMKFWADITKLNKIIMNNPIEEFEQEKKGRISGYEKNEALKSAAENFNTESNKAQYSYNFSWMGRPIIQYPQDMIAMQELIWNIRPDLIIETGIAHGGSLIYYASILELIGNGEVLGIDIDIREHNKNAIETHQMFKRIKMIEGSSVDASIVEKVKEAAENKKTIIVCLDSNHTHEHVLDELNFYAPLVSVNSYIIVFDTIVENLPDGYFSQERPWGIGNNPMTAVDSFLKKNDNFIVDRSIDNKLLLSVAPGGYLKRIK
jgi:cephalosporin hydroxylase/nucleoside-diphosphate-sugar epimerase